MGELKIVPFSILRVLYSIGFQLKTIFNKPVYISPTIQNIETPCFYVQLAPNSSKFEKTIGTRRYMSNLRIIITYILDKNINNSFEDYYSTIDELDKNFDSVKYVDDEGDVFALLRTYNRESETSFENMKYKFDLYTRLSKTSDEEIHKLNQLILNLSLKKEKYNVQIKIPRRKKH